MADDVVQKIVIKADGSQANKSIGEVEKRLEKMLSKAEIKAALFNKALSAGTQIMGSLAAAMANGIKAAADFERTTLQLTTTLRSLGDVNATWLATMQHQAAELERLTGVSDEQIRRFQIMALNSGIATDKVDDLMRASVMLNNSLGGRMGLESAFRNLLKTTSGMRGELTDIVPWIRDLTDEQLRAGGAVKYLTENMSDQLDVMTKGAAGAQMGLGTAWDNLWESMSKVTTSAGVVDGIVNITEAITRMADQLDRVHEFDIGAIVETYLDTVTLPVTAVMDAAVAALGEEGPIDRLLGGADKTPPKTPGQAYGGSEGTIDFGGKNGVSGMTFGGGGGGGGGRQSVARYPTGDTGRADELAAMEALERQRQAEAEAYEERLRAAAAYYEEKAEIVRSWEEWIEQGKTDIAQENAQRRIAITNYEEDQKRLIQEQSVDLQMQTYAQLAGAASQAYGLMLTALEDLIAGNEVAWGMMAAGFLKSIGQQIMGQGIADVLKGVGMTIIGDPRGGALIAHGGAEIAIGGAMGAAGAIAGGFAQRSGKQSEEEAWQEQHDTQERKKAWEQSMGYSSGGSSGVGAGGFAGGYAGPSGRRGGDGGGERNITIILDGPVYDGAQAGRAIAEKIAEARRQGLL